MLYRDDTQDDVSYDRYRTCGTRNVVFLFLDQSGPNSVCYLASGGLTERAYVPPRKIIDPPPAPSEMFMCLSPGFVTPSPSIHRWTREH